LIDIHDRPLQIGGASKDESRTLLFFLSPTCPVCDTLLPTVERVARTEVPRVRVVLASDGAPEEHRAFAAEKRISHLPYVLSAPLGMTYGVAKLPYAVLIDEHGVVAAQGLVNTREHLESLFEAQRHGVASIQEYLKEKAK
jgi:methylamine dehydrogenase accessory protein MauD